ncbi:MAG: cation diffusion facilitator family transporter [Actinomycetota bacterium]|nr:cation diffusion facilitator family transporter [Actinomycetota bacterium]
MAALVILACDVILVAVKGLAGILGGSVALQADAVNSLGDVFTIVLVYFGLFAATRPRDDQHPYGHGRIEDLVANLMGVVLVLFGAYLLFHSIRGLVKGEPYRPEIITVWAAAANVVAKEAMYRFASARGKALRSPALQAVAADFRSDVLVSIGILAGIVGAVLRWPLLDPIVSIPVALMVVYMGIRLYRSSVHALMDGTPEADVLDRAVAIAEAVPKVGRVHEIKGRLSGRNVLLDMKIEVDPDLTVDEGHDIAHRVQDTILEMMSEVSSVLVHVNPLPHVHINGGGPDRRGPGSA